MQRVIVIGGGEFSRVVIETARDAGLDVIGFTDPKPCLDTAANLVVRYLGDDESILGFRDVKLVLGVGAVDVSPARQRAVERLNGHEWQAVVSPRTHISPSAKIEPGAIVLPGAVISAGARVRRHAIINIGTMIDHDVDIGEFVHVAPRAAIGGSSIVRSGAYIGMGAVVRDHIRVEENTLVGMGAVVTKRHPKGSVLTGIPARPQMTALEAIGDHSGS
jgi:acetyltransferase EpsM